MCMYRCTHVHVHVCVMYSIPGYQLLFHIHLEIHVPTDVHRHTYLCIATVYIIILTCTYTHYYVNKIVNYKVSLGIAGVWSCPATTGERPPPCSSFTFTAIDDRRAVLFGGGNGEQGRMNDVYIIDLHTMVMTVLLYS